MKINILAKMLKKHKLFGDVDRIFRVECLLEILIIH